MFINPTEQNFKITSPFGTRTAPTTGASTTHNGIDIAAPIGTPIRAVADGTIKNVWNDTANGGGLSVSITHANGFQSGYAHLSEQLAAIGQKVKQGDIIAKSGNTGRSTGAHLHFTLRYNGIAIDPQQYFYV